MITLSIDDVNILPLVLFHIHVSSTRYKKQTCERYENIIYRRMDQNSQLAIYMAEKLYTATSGDEQVRWYHSYLTLAEQTADNIQILQELHFINNNWKMKPFIKIGENRHKKENVEMHPYLQGDARMVMARWHYALQFAKAAEIEGVPFGQDFMDSPTAINCRTGVKEALEAMGLRFQEACAKSVAGLKAKFNLHYPPYNELDDALSFPQILEESEKMARQMLYRPT